MVIGAKKTHLDRQAGRQEDRQTLSLGGSVLFAFADDSTDCMLLIADIVTVVV